MKLYTVKYSNGLYEERDSVNFSTDINKAVLSGNIYWLQSLADRALSRPSVFPEVAGCTYELVEVGAKESPKVFEDCM